MGLGKYHKKRNFSDTPEPKGKVKKRLKGALRFVVQKHAASRLHYDFRLELGGTLKSWAVPKGPSLDPEDKRLAMQVEDHPLDYRTFEGIIPEGNYGAGTVMVWDEGTYSDAKGLSGAESEKELERGLEKGHLSFVLRGKKLNGEFALVKLRRGGENAWLLIKKDDEFALGEDVTEKDRSVKTKRTLDQISSEAEDRGEVWGSPKKTKQETATRPSGKRVKEKRVKSPSPKAGGKMVSPMLATLVDQPFDRRGWIFEIKWDGYRAIAEVNGRSTRLYSRNHKSFADKYPDLVEELGLIHRKAVLDGEVVVLNGEGKPSFQALQNYPRTHEGELCYYVFDLLSLDGEDARGLPLVQRKEKLKELLETTNLDNVRYSDHIVGRGEAFYEAMRRQGIEGMVAKDAESPYREGERSGEWLKMKTHLRQEAVIAGFTEPRGSRKHLGSLVLGCYAEGKLEYIGHTGTGFDDKTLKLLSEKLGKLTTPRCPFAYPPKTNTAVTWVKPQLVCEVSFQEWTEDGQMRQPSFEGLRADKSAREVTREREASTGQQIDRAEHQPALGLRSSAKPALRLIHNPDWTPKTGHGHQKPALRSVGRSDKAGKLTITHPEKIFWPKEKITKGDLAAYYREIAPVLLPYLKDRPEAMRRYPDGIGKEGFFQKDVGEHAPKWLETISIRTESGDRDVRYLLCQDEATLMYMVNLGCIDLNPWNSRAGHLHEPDYLVIDLDPEGVSFDKVVEVAKAVRRVLDRAELESYPKTSGATGLHIYVPLGARYGYDEAKSFAELVARLVEQRLPRLTSTERSPSRRQRRIYLDFLQNRINQTLAAPYSVRARPGATVSTPLKWTEVKRGLDPSRFTLKNILRRVEKVGDLFLPVLGKGADLEAAVKLLSRETEG